jgi:hypothetical protein
VGRAIDGELQKMKFTLEAVLAACLANSMLTAEWWRFELPKRVSLARTKFSGASFAL